MYFIRMSQIIYFTYGETVIYGTFSINFKWKKKEFLPFLLFDWSKIEKRRKICVITNNFEKNYKQNLIEMRTVQVFHIAICTVVIFRWRSSNWEREQQTYTHRSKRFLVNNLFHPFCETKKTTPYISCMFSVSLYFMPIEWTWFRSP